MGARIRAGRWVCSMTLAMVKVLPEPVTPSRTWSRSPVAAVATSSAMAEGWSPAGLYSECSRKGMCLRPSGRSGRCGVQSDGLPGASSGVRRGPLTGANIGMFGVFTGMRGDAPSSSRRKAAGASARDSPRTWTGLVMRGAEPLGGEERFMNSNLGRGARLRQSRRGPGSP